MKKITSLLFLFFGFFGYGQIVAPIIIDSTTIETAESPVEEVKKPKKLRPLRLGLKIGVPNAVTGNGEYLTPLFDNRVAVAADFMTFSKSFDKGLFDFTSVEFGTNVYFNNRGTGFYAGISYFSFDSNFGFKDYKFENEQFGTVIIDDGKADVKFNTFNLKLGMKFGRTVYFRMEAGYGFGKIPNTVKINSVDFPFYNYDDVPKIFGLSSSGVLVFNIGFGVGLF